MSNVTTKPCPADQSAPVAPVRSALADAALAVGVSADDVRAFLSATYRFVNVGLVA